MAAKLTYVIEFVADMDRAVKFYRDTMGLPLTFQSPGGVSLPPGKPSWDCIPRRRRIRQARLKLDSACLI